MASTSGSKSSNYVPAPYAPTNSQQIAQAIQQGKVTIGSSSTTSSSAAKSSSSQTVTMQQYADMNARRLASYNPGTSPQQAYQAQVGSYGGGQVAPTYQGTSVPEGAITSPEQQQTETKVVEVVIPPAAKPTFNEKKQESFSQNQFTQSPLVLNQADTFRVGQQNINAVESGQQRKVSNVPEPVRKAPAYDGKIILGEDFVKALPQDLQKYQAQKSEFEKSQARVNVYGKKGLEATSNSDEAVLQFMPKAPAAPEDKSDYFAAVDKNIAEKELGIQGLDSAAGQKFKDYETAVGLALADQQVTEDEYSKTSALYSDYSASFDASQKARAELAGFVEQTNAEKLAYNADIEKYKQDFGSFETKAKPFSQYFEQRNAQALELNATVGRIEKETALMKQFDISPNTAFKAAFEEKAKQDLRESGTIRTGIDVLTSYPVIEKDSKFLAKTDSGLLELSNEEIGKGYIGGSGVMSVDYWDIAAITTLGSSYHLAGARGVVTFGAGYLGSVESSKYVYAETGNEALALTAGIAGGLAAGYAADRAFESLKYGFGVKVKQSDFDKLLTKNEQTEFKDFTNTRFRQFGEVDVQGAGITEKVNLDLKGVARTADSSKPFNDAVQGVDDYLDDLSQKLFGEMKGESQVTVLKGVGKVNNQRFDLTGVERNIIIDSRQISSESAFKVGETFGDEASAQVFNPNVSVRNIQQEFSSKTVGTLRTGNETSIYFGDTKVNLSKEIIAGSDAYSFTGVASSKGISLEVPAKAGFFEKTANFFRERIPSFKSTSQQIDEQLGVLDVKPSMDILQPKLSFFERMKYKAIDYEVDTGFVGAGFEKPAASAGSVKDFAHVFEGGGSVGLQEAKQSQRLVQGLAAEMRTTTSPQSLTAVNVGSGVGVLTFEGQKSQRLAAGTLLSEQAVSRESVKEVALPIALAKAAAREKAITLTVQRQGSILKERQDLVLKQPAVSAIVQEQKVVSFQVAAERVVSVESVRSVEVSVQQQREVQLSKQIQLPIFDVPYSPRPPVMRMPVPFLVPPKLPRRFNDSGPGRLPDLPKAASRQDKFSLKPLPKIGALAKFFGAKEPKFSRRESLGFRTRVEKFALVPDVPLRRGEFMRISKKLRKR